MLAAAACTAAPQLRVQDLAGAWREPLRVAPGAVHVLVFTSHECPIANAYAPTLRQLADSWAEDPVTLFLLHVDPDLSAAAASAHAAEFALPGTILLDPHHDLADYLGVRRTPEAAVVTPNGLAYCGRIDDQWQGLGSRKVAPSQHDLAAAVAAALADGSAPGRRTPAVGCLLPEPRAHPTDRP